ncbi:hypothetical protein JTB14_030991 [Gonioctena quinquepunctata]|nr:hypothetical protein JTB14_030991 [Gonioctena quinquepunctata]
MNEKCRLCSSSTALITLTAGKSRQNRDYIRKLIHVTTGIQFKKNDIYNCICYTCIAQIYNFYLFRLRSIQNEELLQNATRDLETESSPKRQNAPIADLNDLKLPVIEDLKNVIFPWIQCKLKVMMESSEYETSCTSESDNTETSKKHDVDQSSEISTQTTTSTVIMVDEQVQVDPVTWSVSIQTSIKSADKKTQCSIRATSADVSSQVNRSLENKETQHVGVLDTEDKGVQCEIEATASIMKVETCVRCDCLKIKKPKITDDEKFLAKQNAKPVVSDLERSKPDAAFLEAIFLKSKRNHEEKKARPSSSRKDTRKNRLCGSTTLSSERVNEELGEKMLSRERIENEELLIKDEQTEDNRKDEKTILLVLEKRADSKAKRTPETNYAKTGEIFSKQAKPTKKSLSELSTLSKTPQEKARNKLNSPNSPKRQKSISSQQISSVQTPNTGSSTPSGDVAIVIDSLPSQSFKYDSPRSSKLLTVKNRVQHVRICRECDRTMYSKQELKAHRKSHMRCPLCKKKFTSITKAKLHFSLECDQKMSTLRPVVELSRFELPAEFVERYVSKEEGGMDSGSKRKKSHSPASPGKKFKG